jgi:hypothetical protein
VLLFIVAAWGGAESIWILFIASAALDNANVCYIKWSWQWMSASNFIAPLRGFFNINFLFNVANSLATRVCELYH